jgi:hypothetical protein
MSIAPSRRVVLIAVATRAVPELGYLLGSASANGMTVTVLGMGDARMRPGHIQWETKMWLPRDWLRASLENGSVRPTDLVVCVDAYDVVFKGGYADILAGWARMGSPDIIMSGERTCYPDPTHASWFQERIQQHSGPRVPARLTSAHTCMTSPAWWTSAGGPYPYVNGGTWGGVAMILDTLLQTVPEVSIPGDDQLTWTRIVRKYSDKFNIAIDYARDVYACVFGDDLPCILQETAPIVHFNGSIKSVMDRAFRSWYPMLQQPGTYGTVCTNACTNSKNQYKLATIVVSVVAGLILIAACIVCGIQGHKLRKRS